MEKTDAEDDLIMSESYGEGYATRSTEEGFGGVCSHPVGGSGEGFKSLEGNDSGLTRALYPFLSFFLFLFFLLMILLLCLYPFQVVRIL